jgi:hypothetical protein
MQVTGVEISAHADGGPDSLHLNNLDTVACPPKLSPNLKHRIFGNKENQTVLIIF